MTIASTAPPSTTPNIDDAEMRRFEMAAARWWDVNGEHGALHDINGIRLDYIDARCGGLAGKQVLDVGCGGGILSEAMAARGARVTGIDAGPAAIGVARAHAAGSSPLLDIRYEIATAEAFARRHQAAFDVVACLELLEHVPDPASVLTACGRLVRPGGHVVVATLNRTARSWLLAIVAAEYLLRIVHPGTHQWKRFVPPESIAAWAQTADLQVADISGVRYIPFFRIATMCRSTAVNYMMHLTAPRSGRIRDGVLPEKDPPMPLPETRWHDRRLREQQLDEHVDRTRTAMFGFKQMPADEKVDYVRRHFDTVAPTYDLMNTICSLGIHYLWKRTAVNRLGLRPGQRVLDVCGGTGDLSIGAKRKVGEDGQVVVYDINRAMLLAGKSQPAHARIRRQLDYIQGDAEDIGFPDASFDAVMVGFGIRNVTRLKRAFGEMHRVLRPGGRLMCLEFSKPVNPVFRFLYDIHSFHIMPLLGELLVGNRDGYVCLPETIRLFALPEELSAVLEAAGFQEVRYRRLTNGIAVIHTGTKPG